MQSFASFHLHFTIFCPVCQDIMSQKKELRSSFLCLSAFVYVDFCFWKRLCAPPIFRREDFVPGDKMDLQLGCRSCMKLIAGAAPLVHTAASGALSTAASYTTSSSDSRAWVSAWWKYKRGAVHAFFLMSDNFQISQLFLPPCSRQRDN